MQIRRRVHRRKARLPFGCVRSRGMSRPEPDETSQEAPLVLYDAEGHRLPEPHWRLVPREPVTVPLRSRQWTAEEIDEVNHLIASGLSHQEAVRRISIRHERWT